jgi:serine/threonine protein phosphatase 1
MGRCIAIGDIHGCSKAVHALIDAIRPTADDHLIFLGDYIDRGPDSRGVIDLLITLEDRCRVDFLKGNHEIMLLGCLKLNLQQQLWKAMGGAATLTSYGGTLTRFPSRHLRFLERCVDFVETENHLFVHANYVADTDMSAQTEKSLFWDHLSDHFPTPHKSGKSVFCGHSYQANGRVADYGHLVCIDTFCFGGRYLTGIEVDTRQTWQFDIRGQPRRKSLLERLSQQFFRRRLAQ